MRRLLVAMSFSAACVADSSPLVDARWIGLDTLDTSLTPVAMICPETGAVLLEGVGDSLGILLQLPSDTAGPYDLGMSAVRGVATRVRPGRLEAASGDSGEIVLQSVGADAIEGTFRLWLRDAVVEGRFGPISPIDDSLACTVRDSVISP